MGRHALPLVIAALLLGVVARTSAEEVRAGLLPGELTLPTNVARPPVVLIIAGSGPTNRDGLGPTGQGSAPYLKLSRALVAAGFATLRYDKRGARGWQPAFGPPGDFRFAHYVADAEAFVDLAMNDPRLGPVLVVGHSEGALVGAVVAQRRPVRGLVALAGAGRPIGDVLIAQLQARRAEAPELTDQAIDVVRRVMGGQIVDPVPSHVARRGLVPVMQPGIRDLFIVDPARETAAVTRPLLIVGGGRDAQVGRDDFDRLVAARPDARAAWIETMSHVLVDVTEDPADQRASATDRDRPPSPAMIEALIGFLRDVTR